MLQTIREFASEELERQWRDRGSIADATPSGF